MQREQAAVRRDREELESKQLQFRDEQQVAGDSLFSVTVYYCLMLHIFSAGKPDVKRLKKRFDCGRKAPGQLSWSWKLEKRR